jgi:hypothetical protein
MQEVEDPKQWSKGINLAVLKRLTIFSPSTAGGGGGSGGVGNILSTILSELISADIDSLFEESPPPFLGKRKLETVAMEAKEVDKDITNSLNKSSGSALKRSKADAQAIVQEWFETFHLNGKAGHIGLVPESLQDEYPTNAPNHLEPVVREHLIHFYEWLQKQ